MPLVAAAEQIEALGHQAGMGNLVVEVDLDGEDLEDNHHPLPYNVVELCHYEDVLFVAVVGPLMDLQMVTVEVAVADKTVAVETGVVEHAVALVDP